MTTPVRRVVTGHLAEGRSTVIEDSAAPNVKQRAAGNASTLLWVMDETPARIDGGLDRAEGILRGHEPRHPAIHRTRTLDHVVVKVLPPLAAN